MHIACKPERRRRRRRRSHGKRANGALLHVKFVTIKEALGLICLELHGERLSGAATRQLELCAVAQSRRSHRDDVVDVEKRSIVIDEQRDRVLSARDLVAGSVISLDSELNWSRCGCAQQPASNLSPSITMRRDVRRVTFDIQVSRDRSSRSAINVQADGMRSDQFAVVSRRSRQRDQRMAKFLGEERPGGAHAELTIADGVMRDRRMIEETAEEIERTSPRRASCLWAGRISRRYTASQSQRVV